MPVASVESHDYTNLIGANLTVGYSDQNESFAAYLPCTGTVVRQIALKDWGSDWLYCSFTSRLSISSGHWIPGFACLSSLILSFVHAWLAILLAHSALLFSCS